MSFIFLSPYFFIPIDSLCNLSASYQTDRGFMDHITWFFVCAQSYKGSVKDY